VLKENARLFGVLFRVADAIAIAVAFWAAFWLRFLSGLQTVPAGHAPVHDYLVACPFAVAIGVAVFELLGIYRPRRTESSGAEARDIVVAVIGSVVTVLAAAELYRGRSYSRLFVVDWAVALAFWVGLERAAIRAVLRMLRSRGWNVRRAIVVGEGPLAEAIVERIRANAWTGIEVTGALVLSEPAPPAISGATVLGLASDIERVVRERAIDQVFLAIPLEKATALRALRPVLDALPLDVRLVPDTAGVLPIRPSVSELDGLPIVTVRSGPHDGLDGVVKRMIDLAGALVGLVLFSPLLVGIAALVRLSSRGPALYRQARVGWGGRPFVMLKFRTMVADAESTTGPMRTVRDDPRRTRFGAFLRRTSLDELPQLVNVLVGDMSLVGPRPERPEFLDELRRELPEALLRLKVKAGMTGLAQVRGLRGDTPLRDRLEVDLEYVRVWSVWLDVKILVKTLVRGWANENAI
jgi:exopolysaccharide biosynthesis polyprenyl glycosylphosphotransferase